MSLRRIALTVSVTTALLAGGAAWVTRPLPQPEARILVARSLVSEGVVLGEEALLIREGRIVALGDESSLRAEAPDAKVTDHGDDVLLAGLIEPHSHVVATALLGQAVDISGFSHDSREEIMQTIGDAAGAWSPVPWLFAYGWDPLLVDGLTPPTREELDALSPERPLVVLSQMMHTAYVNSAALQAAGIDEATEAPQGGAFERDPDGSLTGAIHEVPAIKVLLGAMPRPKRELVKLLTYWKLQDHAREGFTSVATMGVVGRVDRGVELLADVSGPGMVRQVVYAVPDEWVEKLPRTPWFELRGQKVWVDGSPFTGGAAWAEPYENSEVTQDILHLGHDHSAPLNHDPGWLADFLLQQQQAGIPVALHVQGERAIGAALDAIEAAQEAHPRADVQHRLEHNALITEEQLARAMALGVSVSFFVDHVTWYGDRLQGLVGERVDRYMPLASAQAAGLSPTVHGDHPATPIDPFRTLATVVDRRSAGRGTVVGRSQALPVADGLRAMSASASDQLGRAPADGRLAVGGLADFTVVDRDPLEVPVEDLPEVEVVATYVGGQPVELRRWTWRSVGMAWDAAWAMITGG